MATNPKIALASIPTSEAQTVMVQLREQVAEYRDLERLLKAKQANIRELSSHLADLENHKMRPRFEDTLIRFTPR